METVSATNGDGLPGARVSSRLRDELATVAALVARDPSAFEYLYDRWSIAAYTLALGLLGDVALAEHVLEEAFLSVWRQPEAALRQHTTLANHLAAAIRSRAQELRASSAAADDAALTDVRHR